MQEKQRTSKSVIKLSRKNITNFVNSNSKTRFSGQIAIVSESLIFSPNKSILKFK